MKIYRQTPTGPVALVPLDNTLPLPDETRDHILDLVKRYTRASDPVGAVTDWWESPADDLLDEFDVLVDGNGIESTKFETNWPLDTEVPLLRYSNTGDEYQPTAIEVSWDHRRTGDLYFEDYAMFYGAIEYTLGLASSTLTPEGCEIIGVLTEDTGPQTVQSIDAEGGYGDFDSPYANPSTIVDLEGRDVFVSADSKHYVWNDETLQWDRPLGDFVEAGYYGSKPL